jgi:hypothetical protein
LTYTAAEQAVDSRGFEKQVVALAESSEDFFRCLSIGEFLDGEALNYWAKNAPSELLLEVHGRADLAFATRDGTAERAALYKSITHGGDSDALRLLLRQEAGSSTARRFNKRLVEDSDYAVVAKNLGIHSFILRKHNSSKANEVRDLVVDGVTIRVHSLRARKQVRR